MPGVRQRFLLSPPLAGVGICAVIGVSAARPMDADTLSFRISRNTEDLAQTIHSLSQRLVRLEQRLAAMELQLDRKRHEDSALDPQEMVCLENVERLLADCRELLAIEDLAPNPEADLVEPDLLDAGFQRDDIAA